jgi:hypothetical protein
LNVSLHFCRTNCALCVTQISRHKLSNHLLPLEHEHAQKDAKAGTVAGGQKPSQLGIIALIQVGGVSDPKAIEPLQDRAAYFVHTCS